MKYIPLQLKYEYGLDLVEKYCPPNCGGQTSDKKGKKIGKVEISHSFSSKDIDDIVDTWKGERGDYAEQAVKQIIKNSKNSWSIGVKYSVNGEMVGLSSVVSRGHALEISYLATKRAGYGRELMKAICAKAAQQGKEVVLDATDESKGFYKKIGMKKFGDYGFRFSAQQAAKFSRGEKLTGIIDDEPVSGIFTNPISKLPAYFSDYSSVESYCPPNCGGPPRLPDGRVRRKEWKDRGPRNVPAPRSVGQTPKDQDKQKEEAPKKEKPPKKNKEWKEVGEIDDRGRLHEHRDSLEKAWPGRPQAKPTIFIQMPEKTLEKSIAKEYVNAVGHELNHLQEFPGLKKALSDHKKPLLTDLEIGHISRTKYSDPTLHTRALGIYDSNYPSRKIVLNTELKIKTLGKISGEDYNPGSFSFGGAARSVFRHEVGHAFEHYLTRTGADKGEWNRIHKTVTLKEIGDKISAYARTNSAETFAESFTMYTHPQYGHGGKILPKQIEAYFDKHVGRPTTKTKAIGWTVEPLQLSWSVESYCPPNCGGPPRLPDGRVVRKEWKDRGPRNVPAPRSVGGGKPPQPVKKEYSSFTNVADLHTAILQDHGDVIGKIKMSGGVDKRIALAHSKIIGNEMNRLKQEFPGALKNLKVSVKRIELASEMTKRSPSGGVEKSSALATWSGGTRVMRINVMHKSASIAMTDDQVTLGKFHSVSGKGNFSSISGTFRHELGHAVHDRVGPSSRGKFDRILDGLSDVKGSISKYGATDKREAFAEAFAAYTSPSYKGNLPKEVHKYFAGKFPRGKEKAKAIGWTVEPLQATEDAIAISCQTCVHFDGHYACPAYPNGVPMSLYLGIKKHTQVLGCQDGELTWESKQALEMDIADFLNLIPARRFGSYHDVEVFCPPNCGRGYRIRKEMEKDEKESTKERSDYNRVIPIEEVN